MQAAAKKIEAHEQLKSFKAKVGAKAQVFELLVVFGLGGQSFGLVASHVREIIRIRQATRVPNAAPHIEGVVNLRGRILPVINLKRKLSLAGVPMSATLDKVNEETEAAPLLDFATANNSRTLMVVEQDSTLAGLLVDQVDDVVKMNRDDIKAVGQLGLEDGVGFVGGTLTLEGGKLVTLLNIDALLSL